LVLRELVDAHLPDRRRADGRWTTAYEPGPIRRFVAAVADGARRVGRGVARALAVLLESVGWW
jgi:hypothetical protein